MLAVIELNGKQYQVEEGRYLQVDSLPNKEDDVLQIGNVLMVVDGEQSVLGAPFVAGASVTAKVLSHGRGPKVLVYKMRCKKGYRRKNGHRQGFTKIQIEDVVFPGKKASAKPAAKAADSSKEKSAEPKPAKKSTTAKSSAAPKKAAEPKATETPTSEE